MKHEKRFAQCWLCWAKTINKGVLEIILYGGCAWGQDCSCQVCVRGEALHLRCASVKVRQGVSPRVELLSPPSLRWLHQCDCSTASWHWCAHCSFSGALLQSGAAADAVKAAIAKPEQGTRRLQNKWPVCLTTERDKGNYAAASEFKIRRY